MSDFLVLDCLAQHFMYRWKAISSFINTST